MMRYAHPVPQAPPTLLRFSTAAQRRSGNGVATSHRGALRTASRRGDRVAVEDPNGRGRAGGVAVSEQQPVRARPGRARGRRCCSESVRETGSDGHQRHRPARARLGRAPPGDDNQELEMSPKLPGNAIETLQERLNQLKTRQARIEAASATSPPPGPARTTRAARSSPGRSCCPRWSRGSRLSDVQAVARKALTRKDDRELFGLQRSRSRGRVPGTALHDGLATRMLWR